jgi:hypothetical protein
MHDERDDFDEIIACCFSRADAATYRALCSDCRADLNED